MSNLLQRSITGTLIVLVLISCIYMGKYYIIGLFSIITILGLKEFYTLAETKEVKPLKLPGMIVGAITFISATLGALLLFLAFRRGHEAGKMR